MSGDTARELPRSGAVTALLSSLALAFMPLALFQLARLALDRVFGVQASPGATILFLFGGFLLGGSRLSSRYPDRSLLALAVGVAFIVLGVAGLWMFAILSECYVSENCL